MTGNKVLNDSSIAGVDARNAGAKGEKGACQNSTSKGPCPRGSACPFAHEADTSVPKGKGKGNKSKSSSQKRSVSICEQGHSPPSAHHTSDKIWQKGKSCEFGDKYRYVCAHARTMRPKRPVEEDKPANKSLTEHPERQELRKGGTRKQRCNTPLLRHILSHHVHCESVCDAGHSMRSHAPALYWKTPCVDEGRRATELAATLVPGPRTEAIMKEVGWRPRPAHKPSLTQYVHAHRLLLERCAPTHTTPQTPRANAHATEPTKRCGGNAAWMID